MSPTPRRGPVADEMLIGDLREVSRRLDEAGEALADAAELIDDREGSAEYRVARFGDVPREMTSLLVENRDGIGPYGAKGIGDGPTSVMCAAISNALHQATGVRMYEAPFTPERVWRALQTRL